ncbi:predicted protein [Histoplasma mississippiense (nom. inval.)]|uniref:predicted protein n=1 Tax=Ajellomyces capsulatus (strain NAm1 / WU24) TaxID=2059318 RepID=UPI000157CD75|nr:predicted protein [Histoplasma mississippiense (nom. inval.)]EDN09956.1 predicted protein [Histoplasma mississippiense (nom. inval.)]
MEGLLMRQGNPLLDHPYRRSAKAYDLIGGKFAELGGHIGRFDDKGTQRRVLKQDSETSHVGTNVVRPFIATASALGNQVPVVVVLARSSKTTPVRVSANEENACEPAGEDVVGGSKAREDEEMVDAPVGSPAAASPIPARASVSPFPANPPPPPSTAGSSLFPVAPSRQFSYSGLDHTRPCGCAKNTALGSHCLLEIRKPAHLNWTGRISSQMEDEQHHLPPEYLNWRFAERR